MKHMFFVFSLFIFHPLVLAVPNHVDTKKVDNIQQVKRPLKKEAILNIILNTVLYEQNNFRWTHLHEASFFGKLEDVKELHENGANLDAQDNFGWTSLYIAIIYKEPKIVRYLLEQGANPNTQDNQGWSPIYIAIFFGQLEDVKVLFENGAKLDIQDKDGSTPLHQAVVFEDLELVRYLLENGAKLDIHDYKGETPLDLAKFKGNKTEDNRKIIELFKSKCQQTFNK